MTRPRTLRVMVRWIVIAAVGCGPSAAPAPYTPAPVPATPPRQMIEVRVRVDLVQLKDEIEAARRQGNWAKALPVLTRAVTEIDEHDPRSIDAAIVATDALGEAKQGLDPLAALAKKPPSKNMIAPAIAALRALGKFDH